MLYSKKLHYSTVKRLDECGSCPADIPTLSMIFFQTTLQFAVIEIPVCFTKSTCFHLFPFHCVIYTIGWIFDCLFLYIQRFHLQNLKWLALLNLPTYFNAPERTTVLGIICDLYQKVAVLCSSSLGKC